MKQWNNRTGQWINCRQIRALVAIAAVASQCQIGGFGRSTMLLGYNVFQVKGHCGSDALMDLAILAALVSALPYTRAELPIHLHARASESLAFA